MTEVHLLSMLARARKALHSEVEVEEWVHHLQLPPWVLEVLLS